MNPKIIGICGRSCSGKSYVSKEITGQSDDILHIQQDKFFKIKTPKKINGYDDWECPESLRFDRLIYSIKKLKDGQSTHIPSHRWTEEFDKLVKPAKIIIVEGFLLYANKDLCNLFDKKIYIDISDYSMLFRRLKRNGKISEIDYIHDGVIAGSKRYEVAQKRNADIVIDGETSKEELLKAVKKVIRIDN